MDNDIYVHIYGGIPPWAHFAACLAKQMAVFVESDVIQGVFRGLCPPADVDERIDIPAFQQLISRDIIMCGVQQTFFGEMPKALRPKLSMVYEKGFPFGIGVRIMAGQVVVVRARVVAHFGVNVNIA